MAADIPIASRFTVDGTVEYIATPGITFIDIEALIQSTPDFWENTPHSVDVIANAAYVDGKCWLIETKDYRKIVAHEKSPRIKGLDNKLISKLQDTVKFVESSPYCPLVLRSCFPPPAMRVFVFHYEWPDGTPGRTPYVPKGTPLTKYESFLSMLKDGLVAKTYFFTGDDINSNPDIPWKVQLHLV